MAGTKLNKKPKPKTDSNGEVVELPTHEFRGEQRKVVYPKIDVWKCVGDKALTVEDSEQLLGWVEETDTVKIDGDPTILMPDGRKARAYNNIANRQIYEENVEKLIQEHLMRRWRPNGETIIIGKTGIVLNGQHQLIAHVIAEWIRKSDSGHKYRELWPTPITMEKIVVVGIDEDDAIINTMDTCKPRTLTDVISRSKYFVDRDANDRRFLSRMTEWAIDLMWRRTGLRANYMAKMRTHAEALAFVENHPRVIEAVSTIFSIDREGTGKRIGRFLSPGCAAGLMYMMASGTSDGTAYHDAQREGKASESMLDFVLWDKAVAFWEEFAKGTDGKAFKYLFELKRPDLHNPGKTIGDIWAKGEGGGTLNEKLCAVARAWRHYADDQSLTEKRMALKYELDDEGTQHLAYVEDVGGIDVGDVKTYEHKVREAAKDSEAEFTGHLKDARDKFNLPDVPLVNARKATDALIDTMRTRYGDDPVLAFRPVGGGLIFYGNDAKLVAKLLDLKVKTVNDEEKLVVNEKRATEALDRTVADAQRVLVCRELSTGEYEVTDHGTESTPELVTIEVSEAGSDEAE